MGKHAFMSLTDITKKWGVSQGAVRVLLGICDQLKANDQAAKLEGKERPQQQMIDFTFKISS